MQADKWGKEPKILNILRTSFMDGPFIKIGLKFRIRSEIPTTRQENSLQLDVRDSLLDREAVEVLNEEAAEVSWLCTLSPLEAPSEAMSPEELNNCTLPTGRSFMHSEDRIGGSETGGAGGAGGGGRQ